MSDTDQIFERAEVLAWGATEHEELIPNYIAATKEARALEGAPGWKGKRGMTQVEMILNHIMKNGSITQREAYIDYGIQSFHRRLTDLKQEGFTLIGRPSRHPVTKQEYTRYYLPETLPKEAA